MNLMHLLLGAVSVLAKANLGLLKESRQWWIGFWKK